MFPVLAWPLESVLEVTQKRLELKRKVMGLINERKIYIYIYIYILAYSPIDAPETAVLIAICSMNIHQYDSSNFLAPHVPSGLANWPNISASVITLR